MKTQHQSVLGVTAPRARPTLAGAFWLASALSAPTFVVLILGEALWRWLTG